MGWVVADIVARERRARIYALSEWEEFCADHGLRIWFQELPDAIPAFFVADTIVLDPRLTPHERAWWAFHEAFHALYCVGSREEWLTLMACGDLCLAKLERQADEFAALFPEWAGVSEGTFEDANASSNSMR